MVGCRRQCRELPASCLSCQLAPCTPVQLRAPKIRRLPPQQLWHPALQRAREPHRRPGPQALPPAPAHRQRSLCQVGTFLYVSREVTSNMMIAHWPWM